MGTKKKSMSVKNSKARNKARNKSYCFVHFADVGAAKEFVDRLSRYEFPDEGRNDGAEGPRSKKMHVALSSIQGIVPNLLQQMEIYNRKWHPRAGTLALRLGNSLVPVHIAAFRKFLQGSLKASPKTAPGRLTERPSDLYDSSTIGTSRLPLRPGAA